MKVILGDRDDEYDIDVNAAVSTNRVHFLDFVGELVDLLCPINLHGLHTLVGISNGVRLLIQLLLASLELSLGGFQLMQDVKMNKGCTE